MSRDSPSMSRVACLVHSASMGRPHLARGIRNVGGGPYGQPMTMTEAPASDANGAGRVTNQVRGSAFDPILMLASALQAVPSSHAVLLGAGVSIAAGVPSAWGVQEELIRRIAVMCDADIPGSPHQWYREQFATDPTYQGLLEELAPTQHERQAILRSFFEPDPRDQDARPAQPSPAHVALARLAKSGHLRIFVTLNFDQLMERALRSEDVEPTVVRSLKDLEGLAPLHTIRCLVVHLHGDYLTASAMRNTASELAAYEPVVVDFLQRMLHDYALLVVGWSAEYDPALRHEISRSLLERYTSYWVTPGALGAQAIELATARRIVHTPTTADDALSRLADAVQSLDFRQTQHPLTLADAVGTVKREISGRDVAIGVHDRLRMALTHLWEHPDLNRTSLRTGERYEQVAARLVEAALVPAALIAATSYWGDERTDTWWLPEVVRFSSRYGGSGPAESPDLAEVVGTVLFHAAGVASVAAGRFPAARSLLAAEAVPGRDGRALLLARLHASAGFRGSSAPSASVMQHLHPIFVEHLALGPHAYEDAWELFDLLVLVKRTSAHEQFRRLSRIYDDAQENLATRKRIQTAASQLVDAQIEAAVQVVSATQDRDRALESVATVAWAQGHHLRVAYGHPGGARSALAEALIHRLRRDRNAPASVRDAHPLIAAGAVPYQKMQTVLDAVSFAVGRDSEHLATRQQPGTDTGPLNDFWLDTGEPS